MRLSSFVHRSIDESNPMTSPRSELPDDIEGCHALIEQLRAELQTATQHVAKLQPAAAQIDAAARIAHLETLLAEQQQTIDDLSADNRLLKRSLFGSRRERFTEDDPAQTLLFDPATLESPESSDEKQPPPEPKKRTSKGRQRRIFPEFLLREEQRHELTPEDIPGRCETTRMFAASSKRSVNRSR
jgi:small-conductance mechanosensitive channel